MKKLSIKIIIIGMILVAGSVIVRWCKKMYDFYHIMVNHILYGDSEELLDECRRRLL